MRKKIAAGSFQVFCDVCKKEIKDIFGGWFTSAKVLDICKSCYEADEEGK